MTAATSTPCLRKAWQRPATRRVLLCLGVWMTVGVTGLTGGGTRQAGDTMEAEGEVLVVLVPPGRVAARRALAAAHDRLPSRGTDPAVVLEYVRLCVESFRSEGDPRHLSHAEAALAPWWSLDDPPPEVRLWRAIIRQSRHLFDDARRDLEVVTREMPGLAQGWLTLSTVLGVMGETREARQRCAPLRALAGHAIFTIADAAAAGMAGEAEDSRHRLLALLDGPLLTQPDLRAWACATLADICERLDRNAEAEVYFKAAHLLEPHNPYHLTAWADFLLQQGRLRDVVERLGAHRDHEGVALRWACAKARLGEWDGLYVDILVLLKASERAAEARGETSHGREEALLHLELLDDPATALERAVRNWRSQHEPADARLLLACAAAARRPAAAGPALEWKRSIGLEDAVLDRLAATLNALP